MDADAQIMDQKPGVDDQVISSLGSLVIGVVVWSVLFGVAAILIAAEPPGFNLGEVLSSMQLAPIPGVDLSGVHIELNLLNSRTSGDIIAGVYTFLPIAVGVLAAFISYKKLIKLG
ncbi:MAG: hypothetical protein FVQ83_06845 [Chloroflexi bacterium]|nr:hypothetical protein [Chloroflexota bacterium]